MSIECPECGVRVDALPIHKCRKGGDIQKELGKLRDWHIKSAATVAKHDHLNTKRRTTHIGYGYLVDAAMNMIRRQDEAIATRDKTIARMRVDLDLNAEPFTDPNRENKHSR